MNGETPKEIDEIIDTTTFDRIKELADRQGKSLQKVATDLEFSPNYFYNLKSKKSPSAEHLAKIADHFNVSVDYLLGRENLNGEIIDDTKEQDLLAAFRLESKNMSDEGKEKFNESLKDMMKLASKYLNDDKYWKE
ncbi:XRE family transcriptional regulator [Lactococcus petauri]|nr:helix-turn-helix transcriptional regulator [Lactococcus petauri]NHI75222.1 XRE family transcriptional regulator [Lactococcus petauri]